ncbi:MAG: GxxExxY protein [Gemmataceae bacterium]
MYCSRAWMSAYRGSISSLPTNSFWNSRAVKAFEDIHYAQLKSYLKATGLHVGLLLNFNAPTLVIKRVVL